MDDTFEGKIFAPGYGEFQIRAEDEFAAVAVAAPIDAAPGPAPTEFEELAVSAHDAFQAGQAEDWLRAADARDELRSAWDAYRKQRVPPLVAQDLDESLAALDSGISNREASEASQAAIEVAHNAADLLLQHRAAAEVDLMRLDVWARQLVLDAATGSAGEVKGDVATLEAIWIRARSSVSQPSVGDVQEGLAALRAAADAGKLSDAARAAKRLRDALASSVGP